MHPILISVDEVKQCFKKLSQSIYKYIFYQELNLCKGRAISGKAESSSCLTSIK